MKHKFMCRALSLALASIMPALMSGGASAEELTGTLKKVSDAKMIVLGVRDTSIPFSYSDNSQNTIGYSQDIALRVVDQVKKRLNQPGLAVRLVPITSQNRISLTQNGTIDLECGSTTNTFERENQVAFSNSIFLYGIRMVSKKSSNIHDFADLANKTVVSTAGTSDERLLRKMNEEKHMNMHIISAHDHGESFLNVQTDRAAAFVMDEPLLYGERAKAPDPESYVITGTPLVTENYACMLRKDDPQFKSLVDGVVSSLETSGEAEKLYAKWFTQPVPPSGVNLRYPLSAELKSLFAHPNDKALD